MSEVKRFTPDNSGSMLAAVVWDSDGGWVRYKDHEAEMERLTAERDAAQAELKRLLAERDQPEAAPKGREVGRFGLDGHYLDAMEPMRTTDEGIWREAIMTLLPSYPPQKAAEHADGVLAEYRKRWLQ